MTLPQKLPMLFVVSPSVHFRLDVGKHLRDRGRYAYLLRAVTGLSLRRSLPPHRLLLVDAAAIPAAWRRDKWLRELLSHPQTHVVRGSQEALRWLTEEEQEGVLRSWLGL